jgi:NAD(P)H-quinone oxidoreductase subunit 5
MIIATPSSFPTASRGVQTLWILLMATCLTLLTGTLFQIWQNQPILVSPFLINRITITLASMVALVGTVVMKFSMRYMAFDSAQGRFCGWLFITAVSGICLMLSDDLLMLLGSWGVMSLGLHQLLAHYRDNPTAQKAAWKKFWFSRLGDCALLAAILIIFQSSHSWSLSKYLTTSHELSAVSTTSAAWCIAIAAMTKSAQFPFHGWLPETLDAPTPVSAIMHAGAINGGGALLIKFAPAIVENPSACLALSVVGCMTMVVGMRGLWVEPTLKGKLAWSTVAQMGFMTAECGVAAFAAAFLHIVAHGLYKAEGFLRSGTLQSQPAARNEPERNEFAWVILGAVSCLPAFWIMSQLFHLPFRTPSQIGIAFVLSLSIGQAVVALPMRSTWLRPLSALPIAGLALVIYALTERFLAGLIPSETTPTAVRWLAALLPGATMAGLSFQFEANKSSISQGKNLTIQIDHAVVNHFKESIHA